MDGGIVVILVIKPEISTSVQAGVSHEMGDQRPPLSKLAIRKDSLYKKLSNISDIKRQSDIYSTLSLQTELRRVSGMIQLT